MAEIVAIQPAQQQLALDIFHALAPTASPITEAGQDFHLKKSSLLVDVSDVGLLARRVLNAAYFLAQGTPDAEAHTADLRYFKWIINYSNSNNNIHLKRVIREAQKSAVQVNVIDPHHPDEENWVSVPMLGAAGIKKGQVIFKIPAELRPQLRDPERYSLLSMRVLAGFTSIYALELYERLVLFKSEGYSPWWPIDEFRGLIRVDGLKSANDFRYFRRDIIDPAIKQINEISDIEIVLELRRTGRFYSHLRFKVTSSSSHQLLNSIAASKEIYFALTQEFGLSDAELDEISQHREKWSDDRLRDAIEFVRHRCETTRVQYPAKYLMTALRDGYRIGSIEREAKKPKPAKVAPAIKERVRPEVVMPTGTALENSWNTFKRSPQAKLFKSLPDQFDLATAQQKKAFEGFLQNQ